MCRFFLVFRVVTHTHTDFVAPSLPGALANSEAQTADAKNKALAAAGAIVPANFNDFVAKIRDTFAGLVAAGEC